MESITTKNRHQNRHQNHGGKLFADWPLLTSLFIVRLRPSEYEHIRLASRRAVAQISKNTRTPPSDPGGCDYAPGGFFRAHTLRKRPRFPREKRWDSDSSFKGLMFSKNLIHTTPMNSLIESKELSSPSKPIYIRLPRAGNCPITGLSKPKLYQLISGDDPPVKSVSLKAGNQTRGTRLIHLQSLLDYIASFEQPTTGK